MTYYVSNVNEVIYEIYDNISFSDNLFSNEFIKISKIMKANGINQDDK